MYYKSAASALIVYDITSTVNFHLQESFDGAKTWIKELQEQANPNIVIGLAGNKIDLEEQRTVSQKQGEDLAKEHGLIFRETSAKDGTQIDNIFTEIALKLPKTQVPVVQQPNLNLAKKPINSNVTEEKEGSCCK